MLTIYLMSDIIAIERIVICTENIIPVRPFFLGVSSGIAK